jgi:hypothetical protein
MFPLVPEELLNLRVTAAKTGGDGAYNAVNDDLTLEPGDPEWGESTTVLFNLQPPGKKKKNN